MHYRTRYLPLLALVLSSSLFADVPPDQVIAYKEVSGAALNLLILKPKPSDQKHPGFLFFHGGGWNNGTAASSVGFMRHFRDAGFVCASVDYRCRDTHGGSTVMDATRDARSALRAFAAQADELGLDLQKIVVGGGSAGGHLACMTALGLGLGESEDEKSPMPAVAALLLWNPVVDTTDKGYGGKKRFGDLAEKYSPVHLLTKGCPPVLVQHGDADKTVPHENAQRFITSAEKLGITAKLVTYPGAGHSFYSGEKNRKILAKTYQEADAFLEPILHPAPVAVTVNAETGMTRGGQPYFVKGAGGETHLDMLAARGANSLRTWSTSQLAETLDQAQKLGLTVSAGIWLESECSWFSYAKPEQCAKQMERVRQEVMQFHEHPALLAWGLGNEAEGDGTNAAYWQQIDKLALMVKEIDPAHPTFTAVAGLSAEKAKGLNEHTPHLDYVGVNTYGALFSLRKHLVEIGWTRPWLLTEWGPRGFWEQPKSKSGAPLEQTSTEKAATIRRGYDEVISQGGSCLGSYAFVWGWKYEATATWFGLMTHDDETTESVDVLEEKWSGQKPRNAAPTILRMETVPDEPLKPGALFDARAEAADADGDALVWRWSVLPESGRHNGSLRLKMPAAVAGAITGTEADRAHVQAPKTPGQYRLHVWVSDGQGHAATANTPIEVK